MHNIVLFQNLLPSQALQYLQGFRPKWAGSIAISQEKQKEI